MGIRILRLRLIIKTLFELTIDTEDVQYDDYYSAFYKGSYDEETEKYPLYYETQDSKYNIDGIQITDFPDPYDPDDIPHNLNSDSPITRLYKLSLNLRKFNIIEQEETNYTRTTIMSSSVTTSGYNEVTMVDIVSDYGYVTDKYRGYNGTIMVDNIEFDVSHNYYSWEQSCEI